MATLCWWQPTSTLTRISWGFTVGIWFSLSKLSMNNHPFVSSTYKGSRVRSHAVIGSVSSGLKSRPGNCSFTPVVQQSSRQVIACCKFCDGKTAGRNTSESVLASLTYWGCWPSDLKGKTDTARLTMSVSGRSSGVIRVACSGRHVVQDGRSNTVVIAAPTGFYKWRAKWIWAVLEVWGVHSTAWGWATT